MALEIGSVVEGKVTSIAKFGAFVQLPDGKSGLVHISEIANAFVSDVNEFVQVGQSVKVRVLNISADGKINLSIKRAEETQERAPARPSRASHRTESERPHENSAPINGEVAPRSENQEFEDKLKKFMQESEGRIADNRLYADRPRRGRKH
ncbi:MAG: S1 RNA-binding domain-containing protein [Oscillospiraceae bacterium]|nr:S1 RNA-binding domain-containing protein [Oscillospiraceae bacterium]